MKKIYIRALSFLFALLLCLTAWPVSALAAEDDLGDVTAAAALLIDLKNDTVLFDKNAHVRRPPASITKVMTALLVIEAIERGELKQDAIFTASLDALSDITKDSSTQNIKPGEQLTVEQLLYCLLVASANESANILAEGHSGSVSAFVEAMNARAAELGMKDTHFANPHGLHRDNHYTTAYDIFLMTKEAISHPLLQKIVSTAYYTVPPSNLTGKRVLYNTNALLTSWKYPGYTYGPTTGVKTGNTPEAGYCLVSSARQNGRTLISVVLGAETLYYADGRVVRRQFSESRRLLQWGFSQFKLQTLLSPDTLMREIPVKCGKGVSYVVASPSATIEAILPASYDPERLDVKVDLKKESVLAPVKKDEVLGSISVTYDGADYGSANLVAVSDVELSSLALVFYTIKSFFDSILVRLLIAAFVAIVVFRYLRALRRTPRRKNLNDPGEQVKPSKGKAGKSKVAIGSAAKSKAANGNAAKSKPVGSKPAAKKPVPNKSPRPRQ